MCGSTENLEFDHINSSDKSFGIARRILNKDIQSELDKCQLLCHNCHVKKSKECKDTNVKINKDIALQICLDYAQTDMTQKEIGEKYGLAQTTISGIILGKRWNEETNSIDRTDFKDKTNRGIFQTISIDKINPISDEILKTYSSIKDVLEDGYTPSSVSRCINGKQKQHHGYIWRKHSE